MVQKPKYKIVLIVYFIIDMVGDFFLLKICLFVWDKYLSN